MPDKCTCECDAIHEGDDIDEETGRYILRCADIDYYTFDYDARCPCVYLGEKYEHPAD